MEIEDLAQCFVHEVSQVAAARREAVRLGRSIGFDDEQSGKLAVLVTEAATNLVKHTGGGQLLIRSVRTCPDDPRGLEILSLDRGPGMSIFHRFLADGFSTSGSSGIGLGAMERLADWWDVFSRPGQGTVLAIRLRAAGAGWKPLEVSGLAVPKQGQSVCGDAWAAFRSPEATWILVADGLGHGAGAARASQAAVQAFRQLPSDSPAEIVGRIHHALKATRGAAVAVARLDHRKNRLTFAGVGNLRGIALKERRTQHLVSQNGTAGVAASRIHELHYPFDEETIVIITTDGISSQWTIRDFPGLLRRHPSVISGVVYRDFQRGRDDATVVVVSGRTP
jgi:anti-sigma regulatory factor (Ser/Thr protein kinase)